MFLDKFKVTQFFNGYTMIILYNMQVSFKSKRPNVVLASAKIKLFSKN